MTTWEAFKFYYAFWRPVHGRVRAAVMAAREAIKPVEF
jgi:hypothetical protein